MICLSSDVEQHATLCAVLQHVDQRGDLGEDKPHCAAYYA